MNFDKIIKVLKYNSGGDNYSDMDLRLTGDNRIRKIISIKKNREFQNIYRKGRYSVSKAFAVYMIPNSYKINRIGITASKKYGNSVKRNRIRRLIRESYRKIHTKLKKGYDFVIVVRKTELNDVPDYNKVYKEMRYLFKKLNVLDRN